MPPPLPPSIYAENSPRRGSAAERRGSAAELVPPIRHIARAADPGPPLDADPKYELVLLHGLLQRRNNKTELLEKVAENKVLGVLPK